MDTKKCSECLAEIPKQAKKCSHCGSKQKTKYTLKQWLIGTVAIFAIVMTIGISGSSSSSSSSTRQVNESDGYKLAFMDSIDVQYARTNESNYNRLISNIEQGCTLDSGQKVADMLVVTQRLIQEDTGRKFTLLDIATVANERLSLGGDKVRCAEFFAAISTIAGSSL